jgi:hypothetical protein
LGHGERATRPLERHRILQNGYGHPALTTSALQDDLSLQPVCILGHSGKDGNDLSPLHMAVLLSEAKHIDDGIAGQQRDIQRLFIIDEHEVEDGLLTGKKMKDDGLFDLISPVDANNMVQSQSPLSELLHDTSI